MREPKAGRTTSNESSPPPPGGHRNLCGMCHRPIEADGQCRACGGWPMCVWVVDPATGIQVREHGRPVWRMPVPPRACPTCGDRVKEDGWCRSCDHFAAPALLHPSTVFGESRARGIWTEDPDDLGPYPHKALSTAENPAHVRSIMDMLSHMFHMKK